MPDQAITRKPVEDLLLDPENPRLPETLSRDQQSMIDYIATTTSIEDLMGAIAENGYFEGEPLIVVPDNNGKFLVVEGNRRLTAINLLIDPSRCSTPSGRMKDLSNGIQNPITDVPVVIKQTRREVLPYLGFRHITGVKPWEPLAKARYIRQLYELADPSLTPKEKYFEIGRAIGSRSDHIKRNLDALAVYEEIKRNDFYGIEELDEESIKFSILSTALADERIGYFAGISERDQAGNPTPLFPIDDNSSLKRDNIKSLTEWLYKQDGKGRTRVGESRNLRELAAVLDSSRALQAFCNGSSLKNAYLLTSDSTKEFLELLFTSDTALTEAAGMVASVNYDEEALHVSRKMYQTIRLIGKTIKEKAATDDDSF